MTGVTSPANSVVFCEAVLIAVRVMYTDLDVTKSLERVSRNVWGQGRTMPAVVVKSTSSDAATASCNFDKPARQTEAVVFFGKFDASLRQSIVA